MRTSPTREEEEALLLLALMEGSIAREVDDDSCAPLFLSPTPAVGDGVIVNVNVVVLGEAMVVVTLLLLLLIIILWRKMSLHSRVECC